MKNLRLFVQKHKKITWMIVIGYLIFCGCFLFPFSNERDSFDFAKAYIILAGYGIIATIFACLLNNKVIRVYFLSLIFTVIGLISRYLLEYGEYSNTINFTQINIIMYVGIIPVLCTLIYWIIPKIEWMNSK